MSGKAQQLISAPRVAAVHVWHPVLEHPNSRGTSPSPEVTPSGLAGTASSAQTVPGPSGSFRSFSWHQKMAEGLVWVSCLFILSFFFFKDFSRCFLALQRIQERFCLLMNCFGWVPMGHFRQKVVDDNSVVWEEEKSRTVALKQLQLSSVCRDCRRKWHLSRWLVRHHPRGQSPPLVADRHRDGGQAVQRVQYRQKYSCLGTGSSTGGVRGGRASLGLVAAVAEPLGVGWTGWWRGGVQVTGHLKWQKKR